MEIQTTTFVAKLHSQAAAELESLIKDPSHQLVLSSELSQAFGLPATTPAYHIQGTPVMTASYSTLTKLSETERGALEKGFDQFKGLALDEIKQAYPCSDGMVLGAKICLGAIGHIAPWSDPHKQSPVPVLLEAVEALPDLITALEPSFPLLKKIASLCQIISVLAKVEKDIFLYSQKHPTSSNRHLTLGHKVRA